MKASVRRTLDSLNGLLEIEQWLEFVLILLGVLVAFGYILYRGWLHYHLR